MKQTEHFLRACKLVQEDETASLRQRQAAAQLSGLTGSRFTALIDDPGELDEYRKIIDARVCDGPCCTDPARKNEEA